MATAAKLLSPPVKAVANKLTPISIGPAIDQLNELRERKRKLEAEIAEIESEANDLTERLMDKMEAEGTNKGTGKTASASITHTVVGNVTDWDAFTAFIHKKKYYHLLQRRVSDPAIRELFERGVKVPGAEPFTKKRLNLRNGV